MACSDTLRFLLSIPLVLTSVGSIAFLFLYVTRQASPRRRALSAGGGTLVLCLSIGLGLLFWTDLATCLAFLVVAVIAVIGSVVFTFLHHISVEVMSETIGNRPAPARADSATDKTDQDTETPENVSELDN
jgi:predicted lipid-binding transport protein (Tim44 family)